MKKEIIGQKIVKARQAKGLTQAELSELSSVSIRTIQRLELGQVNPRVYTIKTLAKHLDVDLLTEFDNSEELNNKNFTHELLIKWINEIKNLFNLKTYTMKKIIVLSVVFSLVTIGLYAFTKDSKCQRGDVIKNVDYNLEDTVYAHNKLPQGFYAQVIDGDTTYCGLITDMSTNGALDVIQPKLWCVTDFGYKLDILSMGVQPNQFRGLTREEYPDNYVRSNNDTLRFTELGFAISFPNYNFDDTVRVKFNPNGKDLIGFFFNRKFYGTVGAGSLDEKYFRDHYDLKEVLNKFKDVSNLKVTLNNKLINKSDYKELAEYETVKFEDVISVIVHKENNNCEINIKTIQKH